MGGGGGGVVVWGVERGELYLFLCPSDNQECGFFRERARLVDYIEFYCV